MEVEKQHGRQSSPRPSVQSVVHQVVSQEEKNRAKEVVVDTKRFKASIDPPKGRSDYDNITADNLDDDQYFHLTCHVDSNLKAKIKKGEFVELEKLLPKWAMGKDDNRLEWITCDGMTFLSLVQDRCKFDNRCSYCGVWNSHGQNTCHKKQESGKK